MAYAKKTSKANEAFQKLKNDLAAGTGGERLHLLRGGDVSPGVLSQRAAEEAGPRRV